MPSLRFVSIRTFLAVALLIEGLRLPAFAEPTTGLGTIVGRVMNASSQRPIVNAEIRIDAIRSVRTSEDGVFVISGIPPGALQLDVQARGYDALPALIPVRVEADRTVAVPGPIGLHPSAGL